MYFTYAFHTYINFPLFLLLFFPFFLKSKTSYSISTQLSTLNHSCISLSYLRFSLFILFYFLRFIEIRRCFKYRKYHKPWQEICIFYFACYSKRSYCSKYSSLQICIWFWIKFDMNGRCTYNRFINRISFLEFISPCIKDSFD